MRTHSLKELGIQRPSNKRQKAAKHLNGARASKKLNGTTAHAHARKRTSKAIKATKPAKLRLTTSQRKAVIADWLYVVNFIEAIASNDFHAFAELTMTYVKFIVAKAEIPPYGSTPSPSDVAVDEFAQHMAAMMVRVLTEVLTEDEDAVRKRIMGLTVIECLGPRPQGQPRSKASAYPVRMPPIEARESVST